jgi:hypothetical protein
MRGGGGGGPGEWLVREEKEGRREVVVLETSELSWMDGH